MADSKTAAQVLHHSLHEKRWSLRDAEGQDDFLEHDDKIEMELGGVWVPTNIVYHNPTGFSAATLGTKLVPGVRARRAHQPAGHHAKKE